MRLQFLRDAPSENAVFSAFPLSQYPPLSIHKSQFLKDVWAEMKKNPKVRGANFDPKWVFGHSPTSPDQSPGRGRGGINLLSFRVAVAPLLLFLPASSGPLPAPLLPAGLRLQPAGLSPGETGLSSRLALVSDRLPALPYPFHVHWCNLQARQV